MKRLLALGALACLSVAAMADSLVWVNNDTNTNWYCKAFAPISGNWSNGWQMIRPGTNPLTAKFWPGQNIAQLFINCHPDPQKMIISPKHYVNLYMTFEGSSATAQCNSMGVSCTPSNYPNFAQFLLSNPTK